MDVAWDQSQLIYKNILRWLKRALFLPWVKFIALGAGHNNLTKNTVKIW